MNKVEVYIRVEKFAEDVNELLHAIREPREHIIPIDYTRYSDEIGLSVSSLRNFRDGKGY